MVMYWTIIEKVFQISENFTGVSIEQVADSSS